MLHLLVGVLLVAGSVAQPTWEQCSERYGHYNYLCHYSMNFSPLVGGTGPTDTISTMPVGISGYELSNFRFAEPRCHRVLGQGPTVVTFSVVPWYHDLVICGGNSSQYGYFAEPDHPLEGRCLNSTGGDTQTVTFPKPGAYTIWIKDAPLPVDVYNAYDAKTIKVILIGAEVCAAPPPPSEPSTSGGPRVWGEVSLRLLGLGLAFAVAVLSLWA